jgi:transcriptional regulator with XRE-family HTH domain
MAKAGRKQKKFKQSIDPSRPISMRIGRNLIFLRSYNQVSQQKVGRIAGIHQSAVSRVEKGEQDLSPDQLFALAVYFAVSVDFMMTLELAEVSVGVNKRADEGEEEDVLH